MKLTLTQHQVLLLCLHLQPVTPKTCTVPCLKIHYREPFKERSERDRATPRDIAMWQRFIWSKMSVGLTF